MSPKGEHMGSQPARAPATPQGTAKRAAMKRPFGVTLVGVLLLVQGLFLMVLASAAIFLNATLHGGRLGPLLAIDFARLTVTDPFSAVLVGALGVFIALSGVGVLRMLPWAWLAAMALQGWTLAVFLLAYFTHAQSSYPSVLLSVVIVFYLNSRTVRRTFDRIRQQMPAAEVVPPVTTPAGAGDQRSDQDPVP
jgi:hypothetical protein